MSINKAYLSTILRVIIPIGLSFGLFYLIGSFVSASWNISDWTGNARRLTVIWASCFSIMLWYRLEKVND